MGLISPAGRTDTTPGNASNKIVNINRHDMCYVGEILARKYVSLMDKEIGLESISF